MIDTTKTRSIGFGAALLAMLVLAPTSPSTAETIDPPNPLTAPFRQERVLDWGNRPNWSYDGHRIAFTKDDLTDGPAYLLDLETRKVRCLTCHLGKSSNVTRIFHLPDDSFLIEAMAGMEGSERNAEATYRTQLFWLPRESGPVVPLGQEAMGDIAIGSRANADGTVDVSWARPTPGSLELVIGKLNTVGGKPGFTEVRSIYRYTQGQATNAGYPEAYDFADSNRTVVFWTVEPKTLDGEMYKADSATGAITKLYANPAHNETHLFPGDRFGLEESNEVSDPAGPFRGISALDVEGVSMTLKGFGLTARENPTGDNTSKGFDLFVVSTDGKLRRQLTNYSAAGAQAHQSTVSRDGRRIAFAVKASAGSPHRDAAGLYVGSFGN